MNRKRMKRLKKREMAMRMLICKILRRWTVRNSLGEFERMLDFSQ
jgi:hypothetical protein